MRCPPQYVPGIKSMCTLHVCNSMHKMFFFVFFTILKLHFHHKNVHAWGNSRSILADHADGYFMTVKPLSTLHKLLSFLWFSRLLLEQLQHAVVPAVVNAMHDRAQRTWNIWNPLWTQMRNYLIMKAISFGLDTTQLKYFECMSK